MIHKEGTLIVRYTIVFMLLVLAISWRLAPHILWYIAPLFGVLLFFILYFFRDPRRKSPEIVKGDIVCPADGKVVSIEEVYEPEVLQKDCLLISIFMSPLNVHINWNPASGRITHTKHHRGKYLVAWHPKSSTENERTTSVIETTLGPSILVRQIAGAMARRIINYHEVEQEVRAGQELGFIRFGSRVDVYLPTDAVVHCKMGDRVKGNETILAKITP